MSRFLRDTI